MQTLCGHAGCCTDRAPLVRPPPPTASHHLLPIPFCFLMQQQRLRIDDRNARVQVLVVHQVQVVGDVVKVLQTFAFAFFCGSFSCQRRLPIRPKDRGPCEVVNAPVRIDSESEIPCIFRKSIVGRRAVTPSVTHSEARHESQNSHALAANLAVR